VSATPRPPKGLQAPGRRLFREITGRFELDAAESAILLQACRTADSLEVLQGELDAAGVVDDAGRPSPVLAELRQQRLVLARLVAALRIPDAEGARPQRRQIRGVYRGRVNPPPPGDLRVVR
jgi:hypothetical protein